jgi:hypothetical protein
MVDKSRRVNGQQSGAQFVGQVEGSHSPMIH